MKTKIFSLILILALIGMYSTTAYSQKKPMPRKGFFKGQMLEKLKLTDEQKNKIEDARLAHQKQMIDLKANLEKKLLALKELRTKDNVDRNSVIAAVKDINQARDEIAIARANNMMDIYDILTPDQRKTWKENMGFHRFGMQKRFMMHRNMMGQRGMMGHRNMWGPDIDTPQN